MGDGSHPSSAELDPRPARGALAALCALLLLACSEQPAPEDETPMAPPPPRAQELPAPVLPGQHEALLAPHLAREEAPATFRVLLTTTEGEIEIECVRAWSPRGVDRFYNLVRIGYYRVAPFFRVSKGSYAMFGIHANPRVTQAWRAATILDEPASQSNRRGYVAFARPSERENSRSTQVFVNLADNPDFDALTAPIGRVLRGLRSLDALYTGYEGILDTRLLESQGAAYLFANGFGELDRIEDAVLVE